MLAKRIIPCLDVKNGQVVKGVQFRDHQVVGDIIELAKAYSSAGADELVFYDITASSDSRCVQTNWIESVARVINIPFCVAGGIRTLKDAEAILQAGADKISMNSPALENPELINQFVRVLGQQCVVIGIDSYSHGDGYVVQQYTGDPSKTRQTNRNTVQWVKEVQDRGAGEIVLNCMNQDGMRQGYDLAQLAQMRAVTHIPLIASGGAGKALDFLTVFQQANVDGALAASVFHRQVVQIPQLKQYLKSHDIEVRV